MKNLICFGSILMGLHQVQAIAPKEVHALKLVYNFQDLELKPNEEVVLDLPTQFKSIPIDFAFITHKQDPKREKECRARWDGSKMVDCLPAYTSFEVKDSLATNPNEEWRYWGGSGSGPFNSKFAEVRSHTGETDNLYEWRKKGHYSVATKSHSTQALIPSAFRVRSVGRDSLILQDVVVKFLPPAPTEIEEVIFSNGFQFGDYETAESRKYPGRASVGDYGDALSLTKSRTARHARLPSHWTGSKGQIYIPVIPNKRVLFVDVATGDMKQVPAGANAENYRGGARLNIFIDHEALASSENIGTSGVMRASPSNLKKIKDQNSHFIIIEAPKGEAHIMGIRIGYDNNN